MDSTLQNPSTKILTSGYLTDQKVIDECFGQDEQPMQYWKQLLSNIDALGVAQLKTRQAELLKQLQENGVTYNSYGDSNGLNRPWLLDAIPMMVSSQEWQGIEQGMKQTISMEKDFY
jgi:uncharacterized circularly permuted ATP-grasp superfamily protein